VVGRFCYCLEDVVSSSTLLFHSDLKLIFHVSAITVLHDYSSFHLLYVIMFFIKQNLFSIKRELHQFI